MLKTKSDNYIELINYLSIVMKYEKFNKDKLVFKYGDIGDKFFVILNGKVSILLPKDEIMELSEEEYTIYLLKLRKYDEFDLLNNCIKQNKKIFSQEIDDFDYWLLKQRELSPKRSLKGQKLGLVKELENTLNIISNDKDFGKNTFTRKSSRNMFPEDFKFVNNELSVDEYIDRLKPVILPNSLSERFKVSVYNYYVVTTLSTGKSFGDLALITKLGKRTATVITKEDTHFGILDKAGFDNCLKSVKEKETKLKINFLCSMTCFCSFSKAVFKKKYLNLFVSTQAKRGTNIMVQGENADRVFFIKDGEYEIRIKKSLCQLNEMIKEYGGDPNSAAENQYMLESENFRRYMNEKREFRITIINNIDVLGLNDMVVNNIYLYSVETNSNKGEYFLLERKVKLK
jgi:CRP-like cAMP-binding protein